MQRNLNVKIIPKGCAILAIICAVGVLIGWAIGNSFLTGNIDDIVAMNPLTAINFILLSFALYFLPGKFSRISFLPLLVLIFSLIKSFSYFGFDLGIDAILFSGSLGPNRLAPNTTLGFILLSVSFLSFSKESKWSGRIRIYTLMMTIVLSLFSLFGYVWRETSLWCHTFLPDVVLYRTCFFNYLIRPNFS